LTRRYQRRQLCPSCLIHDRHRADATFEGWVAQSPVGGS
jgi:hypothetical protein